MYETIGKYMKIQGHIWKYMKIYENISLMRQKRNKNNKQGSNKKMRETEAGNKTEDGENKHGKIIYICICICYILPFTFYLLSFIFYRLSFIFCLLSFVFYLQTKKGNKNNKQGNKQRRERSRKQNRRWGKQTWKNCETKGRKAKQVYVSICSYNVHIFFYMFIYCHVCSYSVLYLYMCSYSYIWFPICSCMFRYVPIWFFIYFHILSYMSNETKKQEQQTWKNCETKERKAKQVCAYVRVCLKKKIYENI